jgi:hypothetical protein
VPCLWRERRELDERLPFLREAELALPRSSDDLHKRSMARTCPPMRGRATPSAFGSRQLRSRRCSGYK